LSRGGKENKKMRINHKTLTAAVFGVALVLGAAGCKKKVPAPPPPAKPVAENAPPTIPEPKPTAVRIDSFTVEPATIQAGQSATLRWAVANATDIQINQGVGTVTANGQRTVNPQNSTTYTLTANGPGGTQTRTATLTVTTATKPAPPPPPPSTARIDGLSMLNNGARDAFFDYDSSDIRSDARVAMTQNADLLKQIFSADPAFKVVLEGHCDERGSAEYNLGLGDRRSTSAKDFLVQLGVPADRITTISYGKDRPQCTDATEDCYQRNRRVHLAPAR